MVITHTATGFRQHFHPQIIKKMDLETVSHLGTPNHQNDKHFSKVTPRRLPKCTLKSIKMNIWASVCPMGVPLDPRITKMVSRAPKKEPQGVQNNSF